MANLPLSCTISRFSILILGLLMSVVVHAGELSYNLLASTPIGSWQVREDINTDHKGRQSLTVTRSSLLSKEVRNGETFYWLEMVMNAYKLKKGERKPDGEQVAIKSLVPASVLKGDVGNVMGNLRAFGTEVIIQSGNEAPMQMSGAGGMMESMMAGMGTEMKYNFEKQGRESITTPAGSFDATIIKGSSSTTSKVMFTTLKIDSTSTAWLADNVPFGIVKTEGTTTTNGKASTFASQLVEFGNSGAKTVITQQPQQMPALPNMKGLFGS